MTRKPQSLEPDINKPSVYSFFFSMAIHGIAVLAILQLDSEVPRLLDPVEVVLMTPKGNSKSVTASSSRSSQPRIQRPIQLPIPPAAALASESSEIVTPALQAKPSEVSGASLGEENGADVGASERYLYEIRTLLDRRKVYPRFAKKLRHEGRVLVRLQLRRDGKLLSAEVIEKAKFETLNEAAKTLASEIDGLKPFPEEIKKTVWAIDVPIDYSL